MSVDCFGLLLIDIRDNAAVSAITTRIRGGEPAPGDAKAPGSYLPFVVLSRLGSLREPRVAMQTVRIVAKCYAATFPLAAALAGAVSDAIHNIGPRRSSSGVLIYRSFDDIGLGAYKDPDTGQPVQALVIEVFASTVAVAMA